MINKNYKNGIAIRFGQDDQAKIGILVHQSSKLFASNKAILSSFVTFVWNKFVFDIYNNDEQYALDSFEEEIWFQFLEDLYMSDVYCYGSIQHIDNPDKWFPWGYSDPTDNDNFLFIDELGEFVLTDELYSQFPQLGGEDAEPTELYLSLILDCEPGVFEDKDFPRLISETTISHYNNGAIVVKTNGLYTKIVYNTGDVVWFKYDFVNNIYNVTKIKTHDGLKY